MRYFFTFLLFSSSLCAQEVLSPLLSNPNCYSYSSSKAKNSLVVPFFDDFSSSSNILDSNLWISSGPLMNNNYPVNPPTIGVVTLDGLDSNGFAYDINMANNNGFADLLLSQMINLNNLDTAFLLFYYQPQGYGDNPQVILTIGTLIISF